MSRNNSVKRALEAAGIAPSKESVADMLMLVVAVLKFGGMSRETWLKMTSLAWDGTRREDCAEPDA